VSELKYEAKRSTKIIHSRRRRVAGERMQLKDWTASVECTAQQRLVFLVLYRNWFSQL